MRRLLFALPAALLAAGLFSASAAIPERTSVNRAVAYLQAAEKADGSYGSESFGQNADAILAVRAGGFDPAKDLVSGKSPADYLRANAAAQTKAASAAKAALAAKAAGLDPKSVGGTNLIAVVSGAYDASKGLYATDDFSQSIAMLGLACTGNSVPAAALAALRTNQIADGGWGFGGTSDPDTTAIAIQALLAGGAAKDDAAVVKGISWIKTNQLADGGWGFAPDSNASSTAYVIQALLAAGQSIDIPQYITAGPNPTSFLLSQQIADGSFQGFDAGIATAQSIPALAGRSFCNAAETAITQVRAAATPTPSATVSPTAAPSPTATASPTSVPSPTAVPATATARPSGAPTSAPLPPATGSGSAPQAALNLSGLAAILLIAGAGAGLGAAARRRAGR